MYLMVQNPKELPLWGVRVLGRSNKDMSQIGRFGSGLKEAVCLLMRLDLEFFIYTGDCRVDFSIQDIDGHDEICFKISKDLSSYKAGHWNPLGLDPKFGQYDWTDAWQALREIFCNALDEISESDELHHEIVSEAKGVEGSTRFYIEFKDPIIKDYGDLPNKILQLGNPEVLYSSDVHGRLMNKSSLGDHAQIFNRGIWVQESGQKSLFDYDLTNIKLTESRSSDWFSINREVSALINSSTSKIISQVLKSYVFESEANYLETGILQYSPGKMSENREAWRQAWEMAFGGNACATIGSIRVIQDVENAGKTPIVVESWLAKRFRQIGILTSGELLNNDDSDGFEVVYEGLDEFDELWEKLKREKYIFVTKGDKPKVKVVEPKHFGLKDYIVSDSGICYINHAVVGSLAGREATLMAILQYVSNGNAEDKLLEIALRKLDAV